MPQSLPAVYCCWISGQLYLFLWQLCLLLSGLFSLSVTLFSPPFSSRAFGNYNIDVVDFFFAIILHCFFLLLSCFFFCFSPTLSLNIFLFLSLFTYSSVTRSRSSPSPVYVLLSFIFLHLITVTPPPLLSVLHHPSCMWILAQR